MDCFFLEGPKILYRVGLALVHLFVKSRSLVIGRLSFVSISPRSNLIEPHSYNCLCKYRSIICDFCTSRIYTCSVVLKKTISSPVARRVILPIMYWHRFIFTHIFWGNLGESAWLLTWIRWLVFSFFSSTNRLSKETNPGNEREECIGFLFGYAILFVHLGWGKADFSSLRFFFVSLAVKDESSGNIRNMAEFCQQIPVPIEQLLRVSKTETEGKSTPRPFIRFSLVFLLWWNVTRKKDSSVCWTKKLLLSFALHP